jgi:hypothetical protein
MQTGQSRVGTSLSGERQGAKSFDDLKRIIHAKLVDKLDLSRVSDPKEKRSNEKFASS